MTDVLFTNARIVGETEMISGTLALRDGAIHDICSGSTGAGSTGAGAAGTGAAEVVDCGGDLLIPGLVELHTDNIEQHLEPRPKALWPLRPAIAAHDAELAGCGITTVFDALRVGSLQSSTGLGYSEYARDMATVIADMRQAGLLRISHHLHLRAEICSQNLIGELDSFGPEDRVGIVSLMDHTPGQRQFADPAKLRDYLAGKYGLGEAEFEIYSAELQEVHRNVGAKHEAAAVAAARRYGATLASHDDTTAGQVAASAAHGVRIAEFPTTQEAAAACRAEGIAVMMGAPNLVRGGSHSGNVPAATLAEADLLDILSSDYVPASLLLGAVMLGRMWGDMARGIATVTAAPARATGLYDRGMLAPGRRGDLVRLREVEDIVVTAGTWVQGVRVA